MAKKASDNKDKKHVSEYRWYKEVNKPKTHKKVIQDQIDSFMYYIENDEFIEFKKYKNELIEFSRLVQAHGHLAHLDKEYQILFNELERFVKEKTKLRTISQ